MDSPIDLETYRFRVKDLFPEYNLRKRLIVLRMYSDFLREKGLEPGAESLNSWVDELVKRGLSGSTIRVYVHYVLNYFDIMMIDVDERKIRVLKKRIPRDESRSVDYLTDEEVARLIKLTPSPVRRIIYALMYAYARRLGEVLSLTWRDVDLVNNTVTFRILKKKREEKATFELEPWIRDMIIEYRSFLGSDKLFERTASSIEIAFKKDCARAGIEPRGRRLRPHILRHSRLTSLREKGVPLDVISKYLARHSRFDTTVSFYRGVTEEEKVSIPRSEDVIRKYLEL